MRERDTGGSDQAPPFDAIQLLRKQREALDSSMGWVILGLAIFIGLLVFLLWRMVRGTVHGYAMKLARLIFFAAVIAVFLAWNNVYTDPTDEDRQAIAKWLPVATFPTTYTEELRVIADVQRRALERVRHGRGIQLGARRNIGDILEFGGGLCFDKARILELAMRNYGFESRRVAIYGTNNALSLLYAKLDSHAVLEVKTTRGWLLVDTVEPWLALSHNGEPLGIKGFSIKRVSHDQARLMQPGTTALLSSDFTYVYGLYSRHGQNHEPFIPFPDLNWKEVLANIIE